MRRRYNRGAIFSRTNPLGVERHCEPQNGADILEDAGKDQTPEMWISGENGNKHLR
jgi:hypothetical protein